MDLYEHMGKDLFRAHGVATPRGRVARSPEEAAEAAKGFGGRAVVKVQVQAGGRGKGGGVALVDSPQRASEEAARMMREGFQGRTVDRVLVEEQLPIAQEFYTSFVLDRSNGEYLAIMTAEGGVEIETLAHERPDALRRVHIDPLLGLRSYHLRELTGVLPVEAREGATQVLRNLYDLLRERDATLVEVNPLVLLEDGRVVALDAKITIDDNALVRQRDLAELQREFPIDPVEQRARDAGLQYVKLEGEVGVIGNGAGLVMSTLDVVAGAGAKAANFLDVGGGANADTMAMSLEVILSDPAVKVVFINIFGGITRCDEVAKGVLGALERVEATVPIVLRLDGTNAAEGRRIIDAAAHPRIVSVATMDDCCGRSRSVGRWGIVSVLVGAATRLLVQGITGSEGTFHTLRNYDYGTKVVAGVTPGKGGQQLEGIPVFETVAEGVAATGADTSMIFVPPRFAAEAILEAADAGIGVVVCITEGIPVRDMAEVHSYVRGTDTVLVGPNCPGVISPGEANVGIIPGEVCSPGRVGFVSRSGTLVYQIVHELTSQGIGQSTCIGMGGDPVHGIGFTEALTLFEEDPGTDLMIMTGEIGGDDEERAAAHIADRITKPVVAYIAGFEAPPGKRMGHAGAIVTGSSGTAAAKAAALEAVGVQVARTPSQVARIVAEQLGP